jgi:K+ transporter
MVWPLSIQDIFGASLFYGNAVIAPTMSMPFSLKARLQRDCLE